MWLFLQPYICSVGNRRRINAIAKKMHKYWTVTAKLKMLLHFDQTKERKVFQFEAIFLSSLTEPEKTDWFNFHTRCPLLFQNFVFWIFESTVKSICRGPKKCDSITFMTSLLFTNTGPLCWNCHLVNLDVNFLSNYFYQSKTLGRLTVNSSLLIVHSGFKLVPRRRG